MKPFDIELAKAGHPVQTMDGKPVRIICFDRKGNAPIIALVDMGDNAEHVRYYRANGRRSNTADVSMDLVMAKIKKEGWTNLVRIEDRYCAGIIYPTKEEALKYKQGVYVTTIKAEWEE